MKDTSEVLFHLISKHNKLVLKQKWNISKLWQTSSIVNTYLHKELWSKPYCMKQTWKLFRVPSSQYTLLYSLINPCLMNQCLTEDLVVPLREKLHSCSLKAILWTERTLHRWALVETNELTVLTLALLPVASSLLFSLFNFNSAFSK